MKKTISLIAVTIIIGIAMVGCGNLPKTDLTEKGISLEGTSAINSITTTYDPITGSYSPSIKSIVNDGFYNSVPLDKEKKDYFHYHKRVTPSFWNSDAIYVSERLIFSTSNGEISDSLIKAMAKRMANPAPVSSSDKPDSVAQ